MKLTITESEFIVEGVPDIGLPDIAPEVKAKIDFLQAFTFAMSRLNEELGMVAAQRDARQAIDTAKGKT